VQVVKSQQQRADRSLPDPTENAVETGLHRQVGGFATVSVQCHAATGQLSREKLVECLADQAERQRRLDLIPSPDTDRKLGSRHADRVLKHGGFAQPGRPHDEERSTPAPTGVVEEPLQRVQHVTALSHSGVGLATLCGRGHDHAPSAVRSRVWRFKLAPRG
jgi:hypothetical protein